jgi:hypothetical protein
MWLDFNENYSVNEDGQVRNDKTNRILKPFRSGEGYLAVNLGAGNRYYIHHLVANLFCEKSDPTLIIDHINRNKQDNRSCNLRWVTYKENSKNLSNETKPRKNNKLGELYISKCNDRDLYTVCIARLNFKMMVETLEEAKNIRDSII